MINFAEISKGVVLEIGLCRAFPWIAAW